MVSLVHGTQLLDCQRDDVGHILQKQCMGERSTVVDDSPPVPIVNPANHTLNSSDVNYSSSTNPGIIVDVKAVIAFVNGTCLNNTKDKCIDGFPCGVG